MTTQDFLDDFAQQLKNSELKLQKLQQDVQSEQQLFLKLSGAVEALSLVVDDVPDYIEPPQFEYEVLPEEVLELEELPEPVVVPTVVSRKRK